MRGPHNLWRLIRTGATFERTGAMATALAAFDAPPGAPGGRAGARLAVPVARLRGRPRPAADPARADRARAGLHQVRPAALDPPRRRRRRPRAPAHGAAGQAAALPARGGPRRHRARARPPGGRGLRRSRRAGRRRLAGAGRTAPPWSRPARWWRSRCCARASSAPSCATSTPSTSPPGWSRTLAPFARRLRPRAVIAHFEGVVQGELDLRMEASAAAEFQANTEHDPGFRRALGDLAGVRAAGADARMGRGHQHGRPAGAPAPAAPT